MNVRLLKIAGLLLALSLAALAITIAPLVLSIPVTVAQIGVPYNSTVAATGGIPPYTYAIIGGSLPTGLQLNSSTGAITGTPTVLGNFTFTVQVTDSSGQPTGNISERMRPRTIAQSGPAAAPTTSSTFTIGVFSSLGATPVPPTVLLAAIGLVFAGLYRVWRMRQTA
jgi:hypothetical protein